MEVVILVLVVIGALFAIVSGVWVAIALISAISGRRAVSTAPRQANERNSAGREPKSSD
jgi:uncharacterized membrane protein YuzA (DUF378 family)